MKPEHNARCILYSHARALPGDFKAPASTRRLGRHPSLDPATPAPPPGRRAPTTLVRAMASDTDTTSLPPTTAPTDASASTACAADEPRRRRLDHVDSTVAPGLSPLVSGAEVACRADEAVAR